MASFTRKSAFTGAFNTAVLPITEEEVATWEATRWSPGALHVQDAFPNITPAEREFLISGTTQDEWDAHLQEPDDI